MDRRSFLTAWMKSPSSTFNHPQSFNSHSRPLSSGLEAWVPTTTDPWDNVRAGHLLRRTMMMPKWKEITKIAAMTPSDAVDLLLNTPSNPAEPSMANHGTTSLKGLDTVLTEQMKGIWKGDDAILKTWFANVLLNPLNLPLSIIEKMTFFWSGHFTSQFDASDTFVIAPLLYRQNELFRNMGNSAIWDFKALAFNITLDGAMLVYLGGDVNMYKPPVPPSTTPPPPNENYSRELMELFTLGFGSGYQEGDIKEGARILTGWHSAQYTDEATPNGLFNTYFTPFDHDTGNKNYLNTQFSAITANDNTQDLVKKNEIQKMIDAVFAFNPQALATFICRKIYKFFIYSDTAAVDETVVSAMAALFIQNNFDIKPVMRTLLKSAHFFDNMNIGCQIKTPAEYIIGIARQLGYTVSMADNMTTILQEMFNPPNVSGWTGWHDWITTNTYPVRSTIVAKAIAGMSDQNVLDFINQFSKPTDANQLITDLGALMLPRKLAQARHDDLVTQLVGGPAMDYEWPGILSSSPATAALKMRLVLTTICNLPDYQLC